MSVRVVPARSLGEPELARWAEIRRGEPSLASPFFAPDFTAIVAAARDDVRVAVVERDGVSAYLPFQRGRLGIGRPVGSILSDYHGAIAAAGADLDARALIRGCGLKTWEFTYVPATQACFAPFHRSGEVSHQIDFSGGVEAYLRELETAHGSTLRRLAGKTRKLEREHGALRFVLHAAGDDALATLMRWKSEHYLRSGAVDILKQPWVREVLRGAHAAQGESFAGVLSFLYADERPLAAHLAIRSGPVCHSWFPVYDTAFGQYSPGLILLLRLIESGAGAGISLIDLGGGDYRYKLMLANRGEQLAAGAVELPSAATVVSSGRRLARSLVRRSAIAPRLRRLARAPARRG